MNDVILAPETGLVSKADITDEVRASVSRYAKAGLNQTQVAELLGCSQQRVSEWFRDEWVSGSIEATAEVAESLYKNATETNNVAAQIFWMKSRAGWKENPQEVNVTHRYVIEAPGTPETTDEWLKDVIDGRTD